MEAIGFKRGLTNLLDSGVSIDVVTTDRHPSIRKIVREEYPQQRHQYDPWHVAKGNFFYGENYSSVYQVGRG